MGKKLFFKALCGIMLVLTFAGCGSNPDVSKPPVAASTPVASGAVSLDAVIVQAARRMEERLPGGTKIAIVSVASPSTAFSSYVIDSLEAALVDKGTVKVVDRANLEKIRAEQGFQLSGDVSDESAKAIGQMLGAGAIVTGSLLNLGDEYRLTLKAINIESAEVAVSYPADIANDRRVQTLLASGGGTSAASATATAGRPASGGTAAMPAPATPATAPSAAPAPAASNTPAPAPAPAAPVDYSRPGLYVGSEYQGQMDLYDALEWITLNAQNGGVYSIVLGSDQKVSNVSLDYGGKKVTVSLKANGRERRVTYDINKPSYALFTAKAGATFTLEENVVLSGAQDAGGSLVDVNGGTFIMNGGAISDNKKSDGYGGGVSVYNRGTFTMHNGVISGNVASGGWDNGKGGGVYLNGGTFTMNDGAISGNTASNSGNGSGGGVYVASGTFTMNGGAISGNIASGNGRGMGTWGSGGGVEVRGTFTMTGGTISGNTSRGQGGGVLHSGTFTMTGGTISGNTASGEGGGGVYSSGTFTMSNGTISGNTTRGEGGGVYVGGTFTKSGRGGIIYGSNAEGEQANSSNSGKGHAVYVNGGKKRDNTARATMAMDSTKSGPEGGWD
jgi:hypothetical protein